MTLHINIAKEFSPVPIGRYRADGDKSGEAFREDILYPKIFIAIKKQESLKIDFTGMYGLASSFLEEAFGGLVRKHHLSPDEVLRTIQFLPKESHFDLYIDLTKQYIKEASGT